MVVIEEQEEEAVIHAPEHHSACEKEHDSDDEVPQTPFQQHKSQLQQFRDRGNEFFKSRMYQQAIEQYQQALSMLVSLDLITEDDSFDEKTSGEDNDDDNDNEEEEEKEKESNAASADPSTSGKNGQSENLENDSENEVEDPDRDEIRQWEVILRSNMAACYLQTQQHESAYRECNRALAIDPDHVKSLMRRVKAGEVLKHYDVCIGDLKHLISLARGEQDMKADDEALKGNSGSLNPDRCSQNIPKRRDNVPSESMVRNLLEPELARLQQVYAEHQKQELSKMLGQLKDVGNTLLKPFGIDLNNFKLQKDPESGSYSISYSGGGGG